MRIVKPLSLGVSFRPFEYQSRHRLVLTVMVHAPMAEPRRLEPEARMWQRLRSELGRFGVLDQGMWKVRRECFVLGTAYPPTRPAPACDVKLTVRRDEETLVDKRLLVAGERFWGAHGPTDPVPFASMPLDWQHALGGATVEHNPVGKGVSPVVGPDGVRVQPLPNIEWPHDPVTGPDHRPPPAGLGPEDFTLPHRFARMGTYDEQYRRERFPGLADDIDWSVFNVAPRDQQWEGPLRGDETFSLTNMHPDVPRLEGRLAPALARCFLGAPGALRSVELEPETLILLPEHKAFIVLHRAVVDVERYDASDVENLMVALDDPAQPRDVAHYDDVLRRRLDRKQTHHLLRDGELIPVGWPTPSLGHALRSADGDALTAALLEPDAMQLRRKARIEQEMAYMREQLEKNGIAMPTPADAGLSGDLSPNDVAFDLDALTMDELADFMHAQSSQAQAQIAAARGEGDGPAARLRAEVVAQGGDPDEVLGPHQEGATGPPEFRAATHFAALRELAETTRKLGQPMLAVEAMLAKPGFAEKLQQQEDQLFELYARTAQHQGAAGPVDDAETVATRLRISIDAATPVARVNVTGCDLSGLEAPGADLHELLAEGTQLVGARLDGANLHGAVFTRADLSGASLVGTDLRRANLGAAKLVDTNLEGADLREAVLDGTALRGSTSLRGATLTGASMRGLVAEGSALQGITGEQLFFHEMSLAGLDLTGVSFHLCSFLEVDLRGASFAGAKLTSCAFIDCDLSEADFTGADLTNLRLLQGTRASGATFDGAAINGANLRQAVLAGASFRQADMMSTDVSEADLSGADLTAAVMRGAYLIRSDLSGAVLAEVDALDAIMHDAIVTGARFAGANLFGADLSRAVGDDETTFAGANLTRVVRTPRRST